MIKITVCIPVYNSSTYLKECLESIRNQTFTDLEIICVDDGSADNSLEILKEYERMDSINCSGTKHGGWSSSKYCY
ncbi:TPA: glycosyltransferase family 2 protein [Streptococcus suis]|nr:glycosyltransferase [Streptococcus suis]